MALHKLPKQIAPFLFLANAFLILALLWPNIYQPTSQTGREWSDALRGLAFGLSIGLNLMVAWKYGRRSRCNANGEKNGSAQP
jgi:hypothetical protein